MIRNIAVNVGGVVAVIGIMLLLAGAIVGATQLALHGPSWFRAIAIGAAALALGNLVLWIADQVEHRRLWRQGQGAAAVRAAREQIRESLKREQ